MVDPAVILGVIGILIGSGGLGTVIFQNIGKRIRTPADDNDASRVAKEWYRDMLADAKAEREELRKTIEELRNEKTENTNAINRLDALLSRKDERIIELEHRRDSNVAKLQAGKILTLGDILGNDAATHLDSAIEQTQIP